jgi:hypothetical protein
MNILVLAVQSYRLRKDPFAERMTLLDGTSVHVPHVTCTTYNGVITSSSSSMQA